MRRFAAGVVAGLLLKRLLIELGRAFEQECRDLPYLRRYGS